MKRAVALVLFFASRFLETPMSFHEMLEICSEHGAGPASFQEKADMRVFKEIFGAYPNRS